MHYHVATGDCLDLCHFMPSRSVDLVFGSPPYENARSYSIGFSLTGQAWVDWMVQRWIEWDRVCAGLVAMVVAGRTKGFTWSATPARLACALQDSGLKLRNPPIFHRVGIPGSGGPDWLRSDYEWIICTSHGRLPWSDNTAMGDIPKYGPGGAMSHRTPKTITGTSGYAKGDTRTIRKEYHPPALANPGNVISLKVGGGHMGSKFAHDNEAPFPMALATFFIKSFCRPRGIVLDPFCGSGTTLEAALASQRNAIGFDIRQSQVDLTKRRLSERSSSSVVSSSEILDPQGASTGLVMRMGEQS